MKCSIEKSDGVTAVSSSLKKATLETFSIQRDIEVIGNFFVRSSFKTPPLQQELLHGEKLIVHASNMRPVKRIEDVILVFEKIQKKIRAKLALIGSGQELEKAKHLVREKGLEKKVLFLGEVDTIDPYLFHADLFLLPSKQESFGLAALEAMSYSVPVIATNVGGLSELIDEKSGFLFDVGETEKMALCALSLLSDETKRKQMGKWAKKRADTKFSAEVIVAKYERYYQKLLER